MSQQIIDTVMDKNSLKLNQYLTRDPNANPATHRNNVYDNYVNPNTADDWIQVSEARYDSMEHVLQSVRRDIDVLSERINQTQSISSGYNSGSNLENRLNSPLTNSEISSQDITQLTSTLSQTENSKHEGSNKYFENLDSNNSEPFRSIIEPEEYRDICISSKEDNPFEPRNNESDLVECKILTSNNQLMTSNGGKTWRSPSDFNYHDPFKDDCLQTEFREKSHVFNDSNIKTDLDDYHPQTNTDSDESLSPAVSPTFENCAFDEVKLRNIVLSTEDAKTFQLNAPKEENYQIYDDAHSLTTIDEASEENEEEWSSSDLDNSFVDDSDNNNNAVVYEKSAQSQLQNNQCNKQSRNNQNKSITTTFKSHKDQTLETELINDSLICESNQSKDNNHTFTVEVRNIDKIDDNLIKTAEAVLIRPKQTDSIIVKQRPTSADLSRVNLKGQSNSGSALSILSTVSQESMISEAESFVTVCSRQLCNTGSEEAYTTAQSESECEWFVAEKRIHKPDNEGDGDDETCRTLLRKKYHTLSASSNKQGGINKDVYNDDDEDFEYTDIRKMENCSKTPTPLIVTPKFSRFPTRLTATSSEMEDLTITQNSLMENEHSQNANIKENPDSDPHNNEQIHPQQTDEKKPKKRWSRKSQIFLQNSDDSHSEPRSDSDNEAPNSSSSSTSSSSNTSSDEMNEATYDTSQPESWLRINYQQLGGIVLPNPIHQAKIYNGESRRINRKRLSRIIEGSNNSLNDNNELNNQCSSDPTQPDEAVVVIPKYTTSQNEGIIKPQEITPEPCIHNNGLNHTNSRPIGDQGALAQTDLSLVDYSEPITTLPAMLSQSTLYKKQQCEENNQLHSVDKTEQAVDWKLRDFNQSEYASDIEEFDRLTEQTIDQTEDNDMPGAKSQLFQKQHHYPKRSSSGLTGQPPIYPKPNITLLKQNGHKSVFPTSSQSFKSSHPQVVIANSEPVHSALFISSEQFTQTSPHLNTTKLDYEDVQNQGLTSNQMTMWKTSRSNLSPEHIYENEFEQTGLSQQNHQEHKLIVDVTDLTNSNCVKGQSRPQSGNYNTDSMYSTRQTASDTTDRNRQSFAKSDYHQHILPPTPTAAVHGHQNDSQILDEDDIKPASQRKSRILQGINSNYIDDMARYNGCANLTQTQLTDNTLPHSVCDQNDSSIISSKSLTSNLFDGTTPTGFYRQGIQDIQKKSPVTIEIEKQNNYFGNSNRTRIESVQLMQAPNSTLHENYSQYTKKRQTSPSPCRYEPAKESPPTFTKPPIQTKWQLKSIPTDSEIRENMRSRSRQRADPREPRSVYNQQSTVYRPRSSRSDSRYRFTDLDSVIAKSKADNNEAVYNAVQLVNETKQSNSLFDLGAQTTKQKNNQTDTHVIGYTGTSKLLADAKSYNSLLETDIDTGENFGRPVVLETDLDNMKTQVTEGIFDAAIIDRYEDRTRSLYNLTMTQTPNIMRRQTSNELRLMMDSVDMVEVIQSPSANTEWDKWQRAKSYQGLMNNRDKEQQQNKKENSFAKIQSKYLENQGLIDRLKDRARSTHELRIAQSLTKLHIPEWLNKAKCLKITDVMVTSTATHMPIYSTNSMPTQKYQPVSVFTTHSRPLLSSLRSLGSIPRASDNKQNTSPMNKIETVAEPVWSVSVGGIQQPRIFRPSQLLRQKTEQTSSLKPIQSKLYSSMRSLSAQRYQPDNSKQDDIRPRIAPRSNRPIGQGKLIELNPQDFVPKFEQRWGRDKAEFDQKSEPEKIDLYYQTVEQNQPIDDRYVTQKLVLLNKSQINKDSKDEAFQLNSNINQKSYIWTTNKTVHQPVESPEHSVIKSMSDIKDVDRDSGTEHTSEHTSEVYKNIVTKPRFQLKTEQKPDTQFPPCMDTVKQVDRLNHEQLKLRHTIINDDDVVFNTQHNNGSNEGTDAEWQSADAEGETESEVTDGLDQISDLTCLTSLLDKCATRHQNLLSNRPSALEHLLTGIGWWPSQPGAQHRYNPPNAAEAISIAAFEFDVTEDSHRHKFFQTISGPNSYRPVNLGEFCLNQLTAAIQRNPVDGLLYTKCGRNDCKNPPIPVFQALDWCACANCFILYCSNDCRTLAESNSNAHPLTCSFARAKCVCGQILRNLPPNQLIGLTALAKTGMARLGRGGIVLSFALVKHAELFLERCLAQSLINTDQNESSMEQAVHVWEKYHQPSPGGLMAPPIYLTLKELEELDSTVATPCRTYSPTTSMVLIVVVCAYELIARKDGRPVHLFKQSLIVPFPSNQSNSSQPEKQTNLKSDTNKPTNIAGNSKSSQQTLAIREAFMIRLQRTLRERGVSLRHHYPDIFTKVTHFVETGIPFTPVRIMFHDFITQQEVVCTISPMLDIDVRPSRSGPAGPEQMINIQNPNKFVTKPIQHLPTKYVTTTTTPAAAAAERQMANLTQTRTRVRHLPQTDF